MVVQSIAAHATVALAFIVSCWTAAGGMLGHLGHACFVGLYACNPPFCLYGALACVMFVQAWHAWQDRKYHRVREHGLAGLVHTIVALLHWFS